MDLIIIIIMTIITGKICNYFFNQNIMMTDIAVLSDGTVLEYICVAKAIHRTYRCSPAAKIIKLRETKLRAVVYWLE